MTFCLDHDWDLDWTHKRQHCEFAKRLSIQRKNLNNFENISYNLEYTQSHTLVQSLEKSFFFKVLGNQKLPTFKQILKIAEEDNYNERSKEELDSTIDNYFTLDGKLLLKEVQQINSQLDWNRISDYVPGRNARQCMFRYLRLKKITLAQFPWTKRQQQILRELVNQSQLIDWNYVSQELFILCEQNSVYRLPKQCREHWSSYSNSQLKKGIWDQKQDVILLSGILSKGHKWSQFSKQLPGRTQNAIKNRANLLLNKDIKKFSQRNTNSQVFQLLSRLKMSHNLPLDQGKPLNFKKQQIQYKALKNKRSNNFTKSQSIFQTSNIPQLSQSITQCKNVYADQQSSNISKFIVPEVQAAEKQTIKSCQQNEVKSSQQIPWIDCSSVVVTNYLQSISRQYKKQQYDFLPILNMQIEVKKIVQDDLQMFCQD